jgi:hypothetical protein
VVDNNDKVRAELTYGEDGSHLRLYDAKGNARVVLFADIEGTGPCFALLGDDGVQWLQVSAYDPVIHGKIGSAQGVKVKPDDPSLYLQDRKGNLITKLYKGWMGR